MDAKITNSNENKANPVNYSTQGFTGDPKKESIPSSSVCVINSYYNTNDEPILRKSEKPMVFDDVLIYLEESDSFMHGNLSKMKGTK